MRDHDAIFAERFAERKRLVDEYLLASAHRKGKRDHTVEESSREPGTHGKRSWSRMWHSLDQLARRITRVHPGDLPVD